MFGFLRPFSLLLVTAHLASALPRYTVTDLGPAISVTGINSTGAVVGTLWNGSFDVSSSPVYHAFLYQNGVRQDLGTQGLQSYATGLNDAGTVVGYNKTATFDYQPFIYQNGSMLPIHPAKASLNILAFAINSKSQIVGDVDHGNYGNSVLFFHGKATSLGPVKNQFASHAAAINSRGEVVGDMSQTIVVAANNDGPANQTAIVLSAGKATTLQGFSGTSHVDSYATGLNDLGQIVGAAGTGPARFANCAFLYQNGHMTKLGSLNRETSVSVALGINNRGQIVGESETDTTNRHAFIYASNDLHPRMIDLNQLLSPASGWELGSATAINIYGQIVGMGRLSGASDDHAYLLTPLSTVVISGPPSRFTTKSTLKISGHAGGSLEKVIYRVIPSNHQKVYRTAKGTTKWHFTAKLRRGKNQIFVSTLDDTGESFSEKVTVIRR